MVSPSVCFYFLCLLGQLSLWRIFCMLVPNIQSACGKHPVRIWWVSGEIIELYAGCLSCSPNSCSTQASIFVISQIGWTLSEVESEELEITSQPCISISSSTVMQSYFVGYIFCPLSFESIFRVLFLPFFFKTKNCLRYIEFCFGRPQCVFPILRLFVLSLPALYVPWLWSSAPCMVVRWLIGCGSRTLFVSLAYPLLQWTVKDVGIQNILL